MMGQGRSLGTVTYSNATAIVASTSITYTVAQGVPGFNGDTQTPFERATTVDAYNHKSISYTDGFGHHAIVRTTAASVRPIGPIRRIAPFKATMISWEMSSRRLPMTKIPTRLPPIALFMMGQIAHWLE